MENQTTNSYIGKWDWYHDGKNINGDLILHSDGKVTHDCGWQGKYWKIIGPNLIYVEFNGVCHVLNQILPDKLVLVIPERTPLTMAIKNIGHTTFTLDTYVTEKKIEREIHFGKKNFVISGRCKPTSENFNAIIFSQDRSCYGDHQFRVMVSTEMFMTVWFSVYEKGIRAQPGEHSSTRHPDGNGYVTDLESQEPLKINQWNEFKLTRENNIFQLVLNNKSNSVKIDDDTKEYIQHVPFRVGSRYPSYGDGLNLPFDGKIKNVVVKIQQ